MLEEKDVYFRIHIYISTYIHTYKFGELCTRFAMCIHGDDAYADPWSLSLSLFWIAPPLPSLNNARFKFHPPTECCPLPPASRRIAQKLGWHIAWLQPLPSDTRPVVRHR